MFGLGYCQNCGTYQITSGVHVCPSYTTSDNTLSPTPSDFESFKAGWEAREAMHSNPIFANYPGQLTRKYITVECAWADIKKGKR